MLAENRSLQSQLMQHYKSQNSKLLKVENKPVYFDERNGYGQPGVQQHLTGQYTEPKPTNASSSDEAKSPNNTDDTNMHSNSVISSCS